MIAELPTEQSEHEEIREALGAAALDVLSDEEQESVVAHVDQCDACRAELADFQRSASQLAYAARLEPIEQDRSDWLRAQLIARAESDRKTTAISSGNRAIQQENLARPSSSKRRVVNWLTTAALAASIVALAALIRERRELGESVMRERSQQMAEVASLRDEVAERDARLGAITGPTVKVIALAAPTPRAVGAIMFWERASDQWTFIAHDFPPLEPGRTYQLWLVLGTSPQSVGVFAPDAAGSARKSARVPLDSEARPQIAVTEEPSGGSAQPTSDPIIVGQVSG